MADSDADPSTLTGTALLERLNAKLNQRQRSDPSLFRVVEITRDARGRLVPQGQIWHSDLDHVRRFGRAVAANTASQRVVIADADGAVLEQIPIAPMGSAAGWEGWREMPLPPAPVRKRAAPKPLLRASAPAPALPPAAPRPPVDVEAAAPTPSAARTAEKAFDAEATATLTPSPPPEGEPVPAADGVELLLP